LEISFQIVEEIDLIAVYAAVVATFVLAWDIVKWLRSGPCLRMKGGADTLKPG